MRANDLLKPNNLEQINTFVKKYRKSINPPYRKKDYISIVGTIIILVALPLTVFAAMQVRDFLTRAAGPATIEAESASLSGPVVVGDDADASGGQYIQFGSGITGTTYYVDCSAPGSGNGSQSSPWTLSQANASNLDSGDGILFKRGCIFTSASTQLTVKWAGVTLSSYGSGNAPEFKSTANPASSSGRIISITGDNNVLDNLVVTGPRTSDAFPDYASNGSQSSIELAGGATGNTISNSVISGGWAGVYLNADANNNKVVDNQIINNKLLKTSGSDSGAFGVLIHGSNNEIANNYFSGNIALSQDYPCCDGSSVEIYTSSGANPASNNVIHHNKSVNDDAFVELGTAGAAPDHNVFNYNSYTSSGIDNAIFLNTRGSGTSYGPQTNVIAYNNSVYITGSTQRAFICSGTCTGSNLTFRNNVIISSGGATSVGGSVQSNNLSSGNPFVSPPADLNLVSGSPAIDGGVNDANISSYTTDIAGHATPFGTARDIGAYEYGSSQAASYNQGKVAGITDPFRFVAWGDTKSGTAALAVLSNQAVTTNPAFTLYSGDLVPDNISNSLLNTWKNAINGGSSPGNGMFDKTIPVRGNHDFTPSSSTSTPIWTSYFDMAAKIAAVGGTNYSVYEEDRTFSFDYGNSHFVGIDVNGGVTAMTSQQITWLDGDLTAAEGRGLTHAFLYWHGPIYPVSEHCCSLPSSSLVNVLNNHPIVSATFFGHEHLLSYVHMDSSRLSNITHQFEEFIVGNAGVDHTYDDNYETTRTADYSMTLNCPKSGSYCSPAIHGFVTVDVSGTSFTVKAYQKGNTTPVQTWTFNKGPDPTPPSAPTNLTANPASSTQVNLSWTASTDNVGVTGYKIYRNGGQIGTSTSTTYSDTTVQPATTYSYYVTAYDAASNESAHSNEVPVTTPPGSCPTLPTDKGVATVSTSPGVGTYKVWSRVIAPDATNNSYWLQVDSECGVVVGDSAIPANTWTWVDYKDGTSTSKITINLSAGSHTVKMIGRETDVKLDRLIFTTDLTCIPTGTGDNCSGSGGDPTPPTVSITSPANGATVSGTVNITADASDNVGVIRVEFLVDGGLVGTDTTSPYSYPWDSASVNNGSHSLVAKAYDAATNVGTSPSVTVTTNNNTQRLTFTPSADATIRSDSSSTNYGSAISLEVDGTPVYDFLTKFTVSGIGSKSVSNAKLRLYNVDPSDAGGSFYPVIDNSWTESGVTWNNAPAAGATSIGSIGSVTAGNWYEVDVTSVITGDGMYSFRTKSTSSNGADYSSKEGSYVPQLVVTVADIGGRPGDINSDGVVNIFDLSILLSNWGATGGAADINKDGRVDIFDLSILLTNWTG